MGYMDFMHLKPLEYHLQSGTSSKTQARKDAKAHIDAWYESGIPFFTKERIRGLGRQLKSLPAAGGKFTLEDLNGDIIEGVVPKAEGKLAGFTLSIAYRGAQQLKLNIDWDQKVGILAFSPLEVFYSRYQVLSGERDPETMVREFKEKRRSWEASETCQNFKTILSENASGHEISNIVGVACGSLSRPYNPQTDFQHALLLTLKDWLKKNGPGKTLSCYVQDVINTSADKEILAELEFDMIDDPVGWDMVNEQSVVVSIAPNVPTEQIIENIARPAIMIWAAVQANSNMVNRDTSRIRDMVDEDYDMHRLGDAENFQDAMIYIRKEKVVTARDSGYLMGSLDILGGFSYSWGIWKNAISLSALHSASNIIL
ncbi:hypothetical protein N7517_010701 [Penicillium concentricum]|uniref:SRR1-like domain-containing protein n=1 Tax=Penicillium concentricum TaxID=293559 RepID=A0A9W9R9G8_9EURO|nr:uncharacterized protein N7517_010701 [Penicillium concentricum]KAJ5356092.1 hypothetical protein N7517_010701 [Penicillium concentricum]